MRRCIIECFRRLCFVVPIVAVIATGCKVTRSIEVGIPIASDHIVSEDIQSVTVINRSIGAGFREWENDSLMKLFSDNRLSPSTFLLDSAASDTAIQVVAEVMFESGRYDVVVPVDRNYPSAVEAGEQPDLLDVSIQEAVCSEFNTDAVLVLESFVQSIKTDFGVYTWLDALTDARQPLYYGMIEVSYNSLWRLYHPSSGGVESFRVGDSIFWDMNANSANRVWLGLPGFKEALLAGGILAGADMARRVSPEWVSEKRSYFVTGNDDADSAITYALNGEWEKAADVWMRFADAKSKRLRSSIEHNIALAYEMNGDIERAIEWGVKSYRTSYHRVTDIYLRKLGRRREGESGEP